MKQRKMIGHILFARNKWVAAVVKYKEDRNAIQC